MSVEERCPLYGGVILCFTVFWDENICPLFGGVRCAEVSVNGGSTVNVFFRLFSDLVIPSHIGECILSHFFADICPWLSSGSV